MIKTRGLEHVHFIVGDAERSLRFYQQVFGAEESFRLAPKRMVFLKIPRTGSAIVLHESEDASERAGKRGGIDHVGLPVEAADLAPAVDEVERAGGRLIERGEHAPGVPYAYVADPDGNVIEL